MPRRAVWTNPVAACHHHRARRCSFPKRTDRFVDRSIDAEQRFESGCVAGCDVVGPRRPEIMTRRVGLAEADRGEIPVTLLEQPPSGALLVTNGAQQSLLDVVRP